MTPHSEASSIDPSVNIALAVLFASSVTWKKFLLFPNLFVFGQMVVVVYEAALLRLHKRFLDLLLSKCLSFSNIQQIFFFFTKKSNIIKLSWRSAAKAKAGCNMTLIREQCLLTKLRKIGQRGMISETRVTVLSCLQDDHL